MRKRRLQTKFIHTGLCFWYEYDLYRNRGKNVLFCKSTFKSEQSVELPTIEFKNSLTDLIDRSNSWEDGR